MRHHTDGGDAARRAFEVAISPYDAQRARVDDAYRRLSEIEATPHPPATARSTSYELDAALREAMATVTRALRLCDATAAAEVATWSAELVRLSQIGAWLRRTTLDDLGVHVPTTVRVGSRAATAPHIAGMVAEPDDRGATTPPEQRIGVDLQSIVDRVA